MWTRAQTSAIVLGRRPVSPRSGNCEKQAKLRRALPSALHAASCIKPRSIDKPAYSLPKSVTNVLNYSLIDHDALQSVVLLITTNALQHSTRRRRPRTVRRSHDEELSIDELERRERALSNEDFHHPREPARYSSARATAGRRTTTL